MFECQSCLRQAFRAVISTHAPLRAGQRYISTGRAIPTHELPPLAPEDRPSRGPFSRELPRKETARSFPSHSRTDDNANSPRVSSGGHATDPQTSRLGHRRQEPDTHYDKKRAAIGRALGKELRYLKDPLELAKHVEYTLSQGDEDKAAALVRMSSRDKDNIVSWNHLIKYQLKNDKFSRALDTYNDLKKRGLQPDSYTYLILLDGLAKNAQNPKALGRALSIYTALNGPHSKAAPSIIHTNAVLKVCSRAHDLDSIWDILSRLPQRGMHAADARTYTTLLNALRHDAAHPTGEPGQQAEKQQAASVEATIVEGKKAWHKITERWRTGDLPMEEELMCAMGRLLLTGNRPRDWDDVFSLVQQTMNITRLTPRLGSLANPTTDATSSESTTFKTIQPEGKSGRPFAYARPSSNTLSLVIGTCTKSRKTNVAMDYWNLLTDPSTFAVQPDSDNFHTLLRLFRWDGSTKEALTLVKEDMPSASIQVQPKTFRIALATCVRAQTFRKANKSAWIDATDLMDYMLKNLPEPDPQTLDSYLHMTRERAEAEQVAPPNPAETGGSKPQGIVRKIHTEGFSSNNASAHILTRERKTEVYVQALEVAERCLPTMRRVLAFGSKTPGFEKHEYAVQCAKAFRSMLLIYDRVLGLGAMAPDMRSKVQDQRSDLEAYSKSRERKGFTRADGLTAGQRGQEGGPRE